MSNRTRLTPPRWTARRLVLIALCVLAGIAVLHQPESASTQERVLTPLNRFPRMVQEFFVDQVRRVETEADQRRQALATKEDAERYVKEVRKKIQDSFGPWPAKTPLNPRITGVVERDSFKIEKVIFESRPNFLVTANLYIPTGREFPLPGVVGTCGHSNNGKAEGAYQSFAQGLVRQGYVVLLYDPIGQGERLQYPDDELKSEIGVGVREHLYGGNQQFLVGEFFGAWRAWDGIRALDYLLTRPEVDPDRVGVTGNSGGGTMTTWLAGLDNRWAMAAPSCFVTTFRRNLENELPADTEQCPPRALALGLDHSDWLAAMAPRPTIILAKERDYFDARGAETSYWRLRKLYSLLGAEQNVGLFIGPTTHGYSQENREAMYRWFNQTNSISESGQEPALVMEEDETLQCTPAGQVSQMGSRPIFEFTRDQSRQLAEQRPLDLDRDGLQKRVRRMLSIPETMDSGPDYRILREWSPRSYPKPRWSAYMIETEPGISALVYRLGDERHLSRPHGDSKRAVLYVSHLSSDAELREEPLLTELIGEEPDAVFYTVDVRGIGESRPDTCDEGSNLTAYGNDYFYAMHSLMLDRPYVGQRTLDVLRVVDWLSSIGHSEVHLVGKGWGALPATFAALLSEDVTQVTLKNNLTSYAEIAESKHYDWPLSSLLPGVLSSFDLPDCYRVLQAKNLRQIDPRGPVAKLF